MRVNVRVTAVPKVSLQGVVTAVSVVAFCVGVGAMFWHTVNAERARIGGLTGGDFGDVGVDSGGDDDATEAETGVLAAVERVEKAADEPVIAGDFVPRPRRNAGDFINLQNVVDRWINGARYGQAAVEIFDVDYGMVAGSYNSNAEMRARSLYKLFYVQDGYVQVDAGLEDPNANYVGNLTLGQCLDEVIRNSSNLCGDKMAADDPPRLQRVQDFIQRLGLVNTKENGVVTSAHDLSLLLQHFYVHPQWSESSWQKFRNTLLYQPAIMRTGLPAGFAEATVYNKTGYGYGSGGVLAHCDAAMVEFPSGRRYIVVAMLHNPASLGYLAQLGAMVEQAVLYGG